MSIRSHFFDTLSLISQRSAGTFRLYTFLGEKVLPVPAQPTGLLCAFCHRLRSDPDVVLHLLHGIPVLSAAEFGINLPGAPCAWRTTNLAKNLLSLGDQSFRRYGFLVVLVGSAIMIVMLPVKRLRLGRFYRGRPK